MTEELKKIDENEMITHIAHKMAMMGYATDPAYIHYVLYLQTDYLNEKGLPVVYMGDKIPNQDNPVRDWRYPNNGKLFKDDGKEKRKF